MAYCVNGCWTVSNAIGIGTETPSQPIEIRSSQEGLWMYRDGGASNDIRFRSSNGTNASPTAKTNGELMGQLHFEGYDGSSYLSFGGIWSDLDGTVSTGNMPTTLRFFTGTTSRNERMRITSGGNVGIGTTSPGAQFTIQGTGPGSGLQDGQVQIRTTTAANPSAIGFINSGNTPSFNDLAWIRAIITAGNARGSLSFVTRDSDGSNTGVAERMRITNGGNVGIGTSSPSGRLHISSGSEYPIITDSTQRYQIDLRRNGVSEWLFAVDTNGSLVIHEDGIGDKLTIAAGGNVGIGTTAPSSLLHISGNGTTFTRYVNTTSAGHCVDVGANNAGQSFVYSYGAYPLLLGTNAITRMNIAANGNIGVGNDSPAGRFHINHTSSEGACTIILQTTDTCANGTISWRSCAGVTQAQIGSNYNVGDSSGNLEFITSGNTRLLVTSGGNIGMGTTSPSYRLHVNGTFYAAGSSQDYKEGICQYNTDSCLFMCLKPKAYQYKEEWKHLGKDLKSGTQIGLIAEEVAESHPELAVLVNEEDNQVVRNVDYEKLSIILLAEVQKLRQEVDQLNQK